MSNKLIYPFLFTAFAFLLIVSCNESDCSMDGRPAARFHFMDINGQRVKYDSTLTVRALATDSILINKQRGLDHLSLPLHGTSDNTTLIIEYNIRDRDTIWVTHENTPHFISMECGREIFFDIKSFRNTFFLIDSIALINPEINDHEKENFQIYFRATAD